MCRLYILAGDVFQARSYARFLELSSTEWNYVWDSRDIRAMVHGSLVIELPWWWNRERRFTDYQEVLRILKEGGYRYRGCVCVRVEDEMK
jgi:hypothetical protein